MTHQLHCKFFAHPVIRLTEWAYKLTTTGGASNCSIYGLHYKLKAGRLKDGKDVQIEGR